MGGKYKKMIDNNRLNHSLAVSRKMIEIGKEYNLDDNALW